MTPCKREKSNKVKKVTVLSLTRPTSPPPQHGQKQLHTMNKTENTKIITIPLDESFEPWGSLSTQFKIYFFRPSCILFKKKKHPDTTSSSGGYLNTYVCVHYVH